MNMEARNHFVLRFAFGTTAVFILCESMDWQPSSLAAVLTGVLLANLPASPPPKLALLLISVMGVSAWLAFILSALLSHVPHILFATVGLVIFVAFAGLAQGKAQLPLTLLLICFSITPVISLTFSEYVGILPAILSRAIMLAVTFTWVSFAIWPLPSAKPPPPPAPPVDSPIKAALLGTMIVLPVMLVFLLYGLIDAIPVLLTTVLLVAQMEEERGASSGRGKLVSNFLGGLIAIAAFYVVNIAPSLTTLALVTFLLGVGFAVQIAKGGARGANALLGYNATIVIFALALLKGPANAGTWSTRVLQFAIACTFAIGMMRLLWPLLQRPARVRGARKSDPTGRNERGPVLES
ncbi:DUF2955 domain-containing protein [Sphingomonas sp. HDW15A]|uniref:DUF2955 domain-containing protein n=1 Tax=Sphingomonas sp. HDW15A TaxID=2714942 RepID=UPI00140B7DB0|nr:DUF2955 domain-containing protein [Sphingomonas sp. HDW15A]QIK95371.1 DUF2955 domain-containing protein [Sphingomonas sp. HDW15A]